MIRLTNFINTEIKSKFLEYIYIPEKIVIDEDEHYYDNKIKYGGYGVIFYYTDVVIKVISCKRKNDIKKYISPELDGIKISNKISNYFISTTILNLDDSEHYNKTDIDNVYEFDTKYVSMVLMPRYRSDLYKYIYNNKFNISIKNDIFIFVIKSFIKLLDYEHIYADIKLEQILVSKDENGDYIFKIGDIGSIVSCYNTKTCPTFAPLNYVRKYNLNSIQLILFSLGNLWLDLYKDYDTFDFHLAWNKIKYDDTFNDSVTKFVKGVNLPENYNDQKKTVIRWLTFYLKSDLYKNKFNLLKEFELMLTHCRATHNYNTAYN